MKWRREDYEGDPVTVARKLIGALLVHETAEGTVKLRITETEAYGGFYEGLPDDAAHSYKGRTRRTEIIFGEPGHAYVYLIYGMYHCFNIVCERAGIPGCVLIRSGEPMEGETLMRARRKNARGTALTVGPGRLTLAMGISLDCNGEDLTGGRLYVETGDAVAEIEVSKRKNIAYAEYGQDFPWRFTLAGNRWVTK